jgi:hypothetical protein
MLSFMRMARKAPGVFGRDAPSERRWGQRLHAKGLARDPVRSSPCHGVTGRGVRWRWGMRLPPSQGPPGSGRCRCGASVALPNAAMPHAGGAIPA